MGNRPRATGKEIGGVTYFGKHTVDDVDPAWRVGLQKAAADACKEHGAKGVDLKWLCLQACIDQQLIDIRGTEAHPSSKDKTQNHPVISFTLTDGIKKLFTIHGRQDGTHSAPKDRKKRLKDMAEAKKGSTPKPDEKGTKS